MAIDFNNVISLTGDTLIFIDEYKRLWGMTGGLSGRMGRNLSGGKTTFLIAEDVKEAVVLNAITLILKNNNILYGAGSGSNKELPSNPSSNYSQFSQIATDVKTILPCYKNGRFGNSTFFIKNDNSLWHCGSNPFGEAGRAIPSPNGTGAALAQVAANVAFSHSTDYACYVVTTTGELWAGGLNYYGIFGDATKLCTDPNSYSSYYRAVAKLTWAGGTITKMCGYSQNMYFLNSAGTLYGTGSNQYGQLGVATNAGTTTGVSAFTQITTNVKDFFNYGQRLFVLKNDNTLYACGNSKDGALSYGVTTADTSNPTLTLIASDVKEFHCYFGVGYILYNDGTLSSFGKSVAPLFGSATVNTIFPITVIDTNVDSFLKDCCTPQLQTQITYKKTDGNYYMIGNYANVFCNITDTSTITPKSLAFPDASFYANVNGQYKVYDSQSASWQDFNGELNLINGNKTITDFNANFGSLCANPSDVVSVEVKSVNYVPSVYQRTLMNPILISSDVDYDAHNAIGLDKNNSFKAIVNVSYAVTKILISKDKGVTWYGYDGTQLTLINDINDINEIQTKGLTAAILQTIALDETFVKFRLAYLLETPNYSADYYITGVSLLIDTKESWKRLTPTTDYNYTFAEKYVLLNVMQSGTIKAIAYY